MPVERAPDRQPRPEDGADGDQPAVLPGLAAVVQATGQPVRTVRGPAAGRPVGGPVHYPGHGVRGRVHHGQLYGAARVLHHNIVHHAQLRHVPHLSAGCVDARVRGRLRGGVRVIRRVHIHRHAHTREPALAVRTGPPSGRRVLAAGVAHRPAHTANAPGPVAGRRLGGRGAPAVPDRGQAGRAGRVQADGDHDDVPVLPAGVRLVRADRVHDPAARGPRRHRRRLPGDAASGLHQPGGHGPSVRVAHQVRLQAAVVRVVRRLRRIHGPAGRVSAVLRRRRLAGYKRRGHRLRAAQHGHERPGTAAHTVRDARRGVPHRRGRRRGFHRRVHVVHVQLRGHQVVPVPAHMAGPGRVRVVRGPGAAHARVRRDHRAGHPGQDHQADRRRFPAEEVDCRRRRGIR